MSAELTFEEVVKILEISIAIGVVQSVGLLLKTLGRYQET